MGWGYIPSRVEGQSVDAAAISAIPLNHLAFLSAPSRLGHGMVVPPQKQHFISVLLSSAQRRTAPPHFRSSCCCWLCTGYIIHPGFSFPLNPFIYPHPHTHTHTHTHKVTSQSRDRQRQVRRWRDLDHIDVCNQIARCMQFPPRSPGQGRVLSGAMNGKCSLVDKGVIHALTAFHRFKPIC